MDSTEKPNHDMKTLGSLNERAMDRFEVIKDRMKLNLFKQIVANENYPQRDVDTKRIQELLDHPEQNDKFQVKDEAINNKIKTARNTIDNIFSHINALDLPNEVSMAIGLLVSSEQTKDNSLAIKAITILEYFYGPK